MTLDGHTTAVGHVAWSPKGDYLVVCAGGGEADCPDVWIWNVETGEYYIFNFAFLIWAILFLQLKLSF